MSIIIFKSTFCAYANEKSYSEEYIKSLYIIYFTQFIYWPEQHKNYDLCIVANDDLGAMLVQLSIEQGLHKKMNIIEKNITSDLTGCELVYISKYAEFELSQILYKIEGASILSVSDIENFLNEGGMIALVTRNQKIAIEISNSTLKKVGLRASPKLLNIARKVE